VSFRFVGEAKLILIVQVPARSLENSGVEFQLEAVDADQSLEIEFLAGGRRPGNLVPKVRSPMSRQFGSRRFFVEPTHHGQGPTARQHDGGAKSGDDLLPHGEALSLTVPASLPYLAGIEATDFRVGRSAALVDVACRRQLGGNLLQARPSIELRHLRRVETVTRRQLLGYLLGYDIESSEDKLPISMC